MDHFRSCSSYSAAVTSPLRRRWVCASMKPGSTVAWERSITVATGGGEPPEVTETIFPPEMMIRALETGRSLLPSINLPARMAICLAAWAWVEKAQAKISAGRMSLRSMNPPRRGIGDAGGGCMLVQGATGAQSAGSARGTGRNIISGEGAYRILDGFSMSVFNTIGGILIPVP